MRALLLKDFYVTWKRLKIMLLLLVVWTVVPSDYLNSFAILYASMLPYTLLAYDEQCKWEQLAVMMPYREIDIVLGKYLLGWMAMGGTTVLSCIVQALFRNGEPAVAFTCFCGALCVQNIYLPLIFRLGTEKGRMAALATIVILICGGSSVMTVLSSPEKLGSLHLHAGSILCGMALVAALLTAVSISLSVRFFRIHKR